MFKEGALTNLMSTSCGSRDVLGFGETGVLDNGLSIRQAVVILLIARRSKTMSSATENLERAQRQAMHVRPAVGGFPVLAEVLRQAGVQRNLWYLPSAQSVYITELGPVVTQGQPLATGMLDIPSFDQEALVRALRRDQAGDTSLPEFLLASWEAGVVSYDVDFEARTVTYHGAGADRYTETYPEVRVPA